MSLGSSAVFDVAGNGILFVAATAVTNAVDAPDPADPPGSLKARRGDGEVHLEWEPPAAVAGDPDLAYQLRYGAEGGEYGQWRDIPGGPNARSHTVTGLENGTRYAFELRVRRGESGFGRAAEIRQTPEAPRWSVSTNRRSVHEGEDVTLSIATSNAVGFYSAPEPLTLAVIGRIVLESKTIKGADPEDFEIWVGGARVRGYTKDITFLNFDSDPDRDPFPAQHFDVAVPAGSASLDVTVKVLADDDEEEGQEHMSFMVFREDSLVNGDTWEDTGVNIESGDAGVVKQLAVADAEATEGEDPSLDFVVTLAPAAAWTVRVDYATRDGTARAGSDYTDTSGSLTFAPGDTAKTVSVPVTDDAVQDTPETLTLRLSNADPPYDTTSVDWGSEEQGVLVADSVATGTIRNTEDQAEPRTVSVSDASAAEGDSVVFTVSLSAASDGEVTVDYATSDGTATAGEDYTATSGTLAFQAGEVTKTISVPTTEDAEDDGGETFTLTLSNASGAGLGDAEATGTIRNTETAAELSADFPESAYTSKRHTGSDDRPQVVVAFSEPVADFDKNTPSVTVTGASGLSVQAHTEDGLDNAYVFFMTPDGDGDVTFTLVADAACASGGICTAGGTVLTQVPAALAIPGPSAEASSLSVADAEATEEEDAALEFVVTLNPAASDAVTVDYATSDGTATAGEDYTATSGALAFTAGEVTKTISVPITDDTEDDGGETFTLTLSNASGADLDDAVATGTINDDDESPPAVSVSDASAAEGDSAVFTVSLSAASSRQVTVEYATSDGTAAAGSDFTAESGTLTFAANETSKTVSVATTDDSVEEEDETFTLTLSSPANATLGDATATGTINDNDVSTAPLTASFSDMPASHTGGEFTFGLAFSEEFELGYVTLRDTAFVVTGGEVKTAQRQQQGSNQAWNITVEPRRPGRRDDHAAGDDRLRRERRDLYRGWPAAVALAVERGRGPGEHSGVERVRCERGRGRCGRLHGVAVGGEQPAGDGRLRHVWRHGDERDRLHGGVRDADVRGERDLEDRERCDDGRLGRRGRRDVHADAVEPGERDAGRRDGHRHDQRRRRQCGAADGELQRHARLAHGRGVHVRAGVQRKRRAQLRDASRHRVRRDRWRGEEGPAPTAGQQPGMEHHGRAGFGERHGEHHAAGDDRLRRG